MSSSLHGGAQRTSHSKRKRSKPKPRIEIPKRAMDSYKIEDSADPAFVSGNIQIDSTGMRHTMSDDMDGASTPPLSSLIQNWDDVQFGDILGRGASSYVQSALHTPSNTRLALKILNIYERENRHQLLKELRTLYQADCAYLVSFHGAYFRDGSITIALELMEAGSLQDLVQKFGAVPEEVLAVITNEVLQGLLYLHKRRHQIHRDIKPSNICLTDTGHAKLTDFGLTAELQDSVAMCETFVGTCTYMSPERIKGSEYSYASDVWGVGITLLECALGKFPYPHTGIYIDLVQSIVNDPVPELDNPSFSAEFRDFVASCMHKNPDLRPSTESLLQHAWLQKYHTPVSVRQWLQHKRAMSATPA